MKNIIKTLSGAQPGQIIYFVAITFVVLLGFGGLAIDGGRLYNDRRITQGTADTVAFTGALVIGQYILDDPKNLTQAIEDLAIDAALDRALENGGFVEYDPLVDIANQPKSATINISGPYQDDGVYYLVEVELRSEIPPTFIQLVYDGPLVNTGRAVAKARPRQNLAYGYTIFGVDAHGCNAVDIGGTSDTVVEGGGIFSNSDACANNCKSIVVGGNIDVYVDGDFSGVGCYEINGGSTTLDPIPTTGATPYDQVAIPEPVCDKDVYNFFGGTKPMPDFGNAYNNVHDVVYLDPGRYDEIKIVGGDVFLRTGLYCIGSGGLNMSTGASLQGENVSLYFHSGGDMKLTGGYVDLSAPTEELIDDDDNNWQGMLVYMVDSGEIDVGGNGEMYYTGTVMALEPPWNAGPKCDFNGGAGTNGFGVQLICWSVRYTGGADSYLSYSPPDNYYYPATIDLIE